MQTGGLGMKGIPITLYNKKEIGRDAFNKPIYDEVPETVSNVLIEAISSTEVLEMLSLTGRKAVYRLGIPKGDTHDWNDKKVSFFGQDFRTIGIPVEGIEEMIPLEWNKKVTVERYE